MQISSRFTIAVHVLIAIETFKNDHKITSEFLASSANVNPTVIRRLLQQLKKAEIVIVKRGSGGADIEKSLTEITLLDVYNAVEPVEMDSCFISMRIRMSYALWDGTFTGSWITGLKKYRMPWKIKCEE